MSFEKNEDKQMRRFVCVYHPVVLDSNPMYTIYAFSIYSLILCYISHFVEDEKTKKTPGLAHF